MRRVVTRLFLGTIAAVGALGLFWPHSSAADKPARAAADPKLEVLPTPQGDSVMGNASCASMACHHGNGPRGAARSEYSTWAGFDKHARAFAVLYDDRSERMARNLYGDGAHAYERQLCLNCHSMKNEKTAGLGARFSVADGVGCESCHGPAQRWLTEHYRVGFKEKSPEEKAGYGLLPTKDLVARGKICADCHIGNLARNMEVNHDLIAAGHPRLNFEYSGYLHMYPRHWRMADEKERYPDFHARAWAVGQVVSARAAVVQLKQRAESGGERAGAPWPEFSEYGCFACHKDLKLIGTDSKDRSAQAAKYKHRLPGALPYGTWYLPLAESFARLSDRDGSLRELVVLMEKPTVTPAAVAEQANKAVKALDDWLDALARGSPMRKNDVRTLLGRLADAGQKQAATLDWDQAAQFYLAFAALNEGLADLDRSHRDRTSPALKKDLRAVGERLRGAFTKGFDSPRAFDPRGNPSLEQQFRDICDLVGKPAE